MAMIEDQLQSSPRFSSLCASGAENSVREVVDRLCPALKHVEYIQRTGGHVDLAIT
jgi:hypothetical protein